MHAEERERLILHAMCETGFVSYRHLETSLDASPATIRRDLIWLEERGSILRVHGGAKLVVAEPIDKTVSSRLAGTPFSLSLEQHLARKQAIGKLAASMCRPGEGIMVDGGTTTFQMCPHLAGMNLQVLTNSLHIVDALLPQDGTRILLPSGTVFREQNIILAPAGEGSMPQFHASKLFMGAAAVASQGVMQQDVILVAAERRLIDRAEEVILLIDSSKFRQTSGAIVCALSEIDVLITDAGIDDVSREMVLAAQIRLAIAD